MVTAELRCSIESVAHDMGSIELVRTHVLFRPDFSRIVRSALIAAGGKVEQAGIDRGAGCGKGMR